MSVPTARLYADKARFSRNNANGSSPKLTCGEFAERYKLESGSVRAAITADAKSGTPILTTALYSGAGVNGSTRRYPLPDLLRLARQHGLLPAR